MILSSGFKVPKISEFIFGKWLSHLFRYSHRINQTTMNILLLGAGGREHALAWKMAQSPHCTKLLIAPAMRYSAVWYQQAIWRE
jgi:hypothetical protein